MFFPLSNRACTVVASQRDGVQGHGVHDMGMGCEYLVYGYRGAIPNLHPVNQPAAREDCWQWGMAAKCK